LVQKLPLGIAAALLLAFVALSATPARKVDAQDANVVVKAGGGETGYAVNAFLPGSVTIMEGQSVTWTIPWYEPHSIVFVPEGAPLPTEASPPGTEWPNDDPGYAYSTLLFGDPANPPSFGPIVFPEAGDYTYFCEIHPLMTGTVHVVASGDVDTQAEIDARAETEYAARLASINQVAADLGAVGADRPGAMDQPPELVVGGVNVPRRRTAVLPLPNVCRRHRERVTSIGTYRHLHRASGRKATCSQSADGRDVRRHRVHPQRHLDDGTRARRVHQL
jgi:plastocyanin